MVLKFGGTSLADASCIGRAVALIAAERAAGRKLVVVASAAAGDTDRLLAECRSYATEPDPVAMDLLLATGEQASVARLVLALAARGIPAEAFTGARAGVLTDSAAGKARILRMDCAAVEAVLAAGSVAVVAGFQGVDANGAVTTLGRGGSDTTAVALAAALGAEECRIYTDVDGVFSADPRLEPAARRLDRIHCEEMLELAGLGSKVLAIESVDYAAQHAVPLRVLSTFAATAGTAVHHGDDPGAPPVVGVASSAAEAELAAIGLPARPGLAAALIAPLAAARVAVDTVLQNEARGGRSDVSFSVPRRDLALARSILAREAGRLGAERLVEDATVAKVSLVGRGLRSNAPLLARALLALEREGVAVRIVVANETRLSAIVAESSLACAVRALHREFGLGESP
ncbi:MAG TPA: aspartate kinase [Gammaproteobacteria bacterium]|nr:aspartate kinase [Gammaproteobacteria bacterium]